VAYRDVQTAINFGQQVLGFFGAVPGLGQVIQFGEDIVGAFTTASEQEAYNRKIWNYYATPVSQGGGLNYGSRAHSYRSFKLRQIRALLRHQ
jgi:hypothetical protein